MLSRQLLIIFLIIFGIASCSERKRIELSLLNIYVEDTISYKKLSYKIRVVNTGDRDVQLNFKKEKSIFPLPSDDSDPNAAIFLFNSSGNSKCELQLSSIYPEKIIVKKKKKIDLLFYGSCGEIVPLQGEFVNKFRYLEEIESLIKRENIFFIGYDKYRKVSDSIPVKIDSNIKNIWRNATVEDMK